MLDMVILLMCIWRSGGSTGQGQIIGQAAAQGSGAQSVPSSSDNRGSSGARRGAKAPLIPFLKRVEAIQVFGKEPEPDEGMNKINQNKLAY